MKVKNLLFGLALALACGLSAAPILAQQSMGGGIASTGPSVAGVDAQGIRNYLLGPGDTIDVRVFGLPEMNWTGEVDNDGTVSLPFIDTPVKALCRSEKEVQKEVVAGYARFLKNPQISVRITGRSSRPPATIYGAVATPSRVQMLRNVRLTELIAVSGGLTERANGTIQVFHTDKVLCPAGDIPEEEEPVYDENGAPILKLFKVSDLYSGKPQGNPLIRPGDVVTVMEAEPIYIVGGVAAPQPVLMREGLTLTEALAQVGGVVQDAKISDVRVYRSNKPGASLRERVTVNANLEHIKKKKADDVLLQPYDIIEVPLKSRWSPDILFGSFLQGMAGIVPRAVAPAGPARVIR